MEPFDVRDLLRLLFLPGLGPLKIRALIDHFGSPQEALGARPAKLIQVRGIHKSLASVIHRSRIPEAIIQDQIQSLNALGGSIVSLWDENYPPLLKRIYDPPIVLYVLGDLAPFDEHILAIVGTRTPSPYGERVVRELVEDLVVSGYGIVSGLARGIDTHAHLSTLQHRGKTIGVLGSGLDIPYPKENNALMQTMAENGAVITEFPMGTMPEAQNFPRRNRIVSGMSRGTIVVESARDGGAMITASMALDQNRDVFAVPGSMFNPGSEGPHTLIREGRAKLVHSAESILEEFPGGRSARSRSEAPSPPPDLTLFEQRIAEVLSEDPMHVDQIADRTSIGMPDTLVALLGLECKKLARQLPGRFFVSLQ